MKENTGLAKPLDQKTRKKHFTSGIKKGKNEETAYCMVGFYYFDREHYNELKKQYQGKGVPIHTMSGCLAETITLDRLIGQIETEQFKSYLDNPIERPTNGQAEIQMQ